MIKIIQLSFPAQRFSFPSLLHTDRFEVLCCSTIEEVEKIVKVNRIEILFYVVDKRIVDFSTVKAIEEISDIPCIVFGEEDNSEISLSYLKAGSDYYISLQSDEDIFKTCMNHIESSLIRIERLAYRDTLTGAYNRRFFEMIANIEMEQSKVNQRPLSLAILDIDRFKQVNDTYGHLFGDEVLAGFVGLLNRFKREEDYLIRLGGEEFVILMPGSDITAANKIMNGILNEVQISPVAVHEINDYYITFSSGVSEWRRGLGISEWLKDADNRLYAAKQNGRNRIEAGEGENLAQEINEASIIVYAQTEIGRRSFQALFNGEIKNLYLAETQTDTLRQLEEQTYDLLIIEDHLSKVDLELIKNINAKYEISIMMLYPQKHPDLVSIINLGIDDFIIQPYLDEDILFKTKTVILHKKAKS